MGSARSVPGTASSLRGWQLRGVLVPASAVGIFLFPPAMVLARGVVATKPPPATRRAPAHPQKSTSFCFCFSFRSGDGTKGKRTVFLTRFFLLLLIIV